MLGVAHAPTPAPRASIEDLIVAVSTTVGAWLLAHQFRLDVVGVRPLARLASDSIFTATKL